MYHDIIAKCAIIIDINIGVNDTIFSYPYIVAYKNIGHDQASFPDYRGLTYHFCRRSKWSEMPYQLKICFKWLINDEYRFAFGYINFLINNNEACFAVQTLIIILWMVNKNNVSMLNTVYFINTPCLSICLSNQFCIDR